MRLPLAIALLAVLSAGCEVLLPEVGNEGQPCLDNGTCRNGLHCVDDPSGGTYCQPGGESDGWDGDAGHEGDAGEDGDGGSDDDGNQDGADQPSGRSIGGGLSGLAPAASVVLQNNLIDNLTLAENGPFSFPIRLEQGEDYSVTVARQPTSPWQTCTVIDGAGTVGSGDISSVRVGCETNSYQVSVEVSNLDGSGLVLQNNGGDDISIESSGVYSFATLIPSGQPYLVTVLSQPTLPWQTCVVSSPQGTVVGTGITLQVDCATDAFFVGGALEGLRTMDVVLQNNLGDNLHLSADGAFGFATPVLSGQSYSVTIGSQPSDRVCSVFGGEGVVGGENVSSVRVHCVSFLPVYQHRFSTETEIPAGHGWQALAGSSLTIETHGGPLEIEISIPLTGSNYGACRPVVDGVWPGTYEGLPQDFRWSEGIETTAYVVVLERTFQRTRAFTGIPAGLHEVSIQCRAEGSGMMTAGSAGSAALVITREFLGGNILWQRVSTSEIPVHASAQMVKLDGSDLAVTTHGLPLEITISLPLGEGDFMACLEWMGDEVIPSTPPYVDDYWYAGVEVTQATGYIMWHHTRTYSGIPAGAHTFSIRCHGNAADSLAGYAESASVLIVKEIDEGEQPSTQLLSANLGGEFITDGAANAWLPLAGFDQEVNILRGALEIYASFEYGWIPGGKKLSCRPTLDGQWAGSFAGLTPLSWEEEGSTTTVGTANGPGMWHRGRVYTNLPTGTHTIGMECRSDQTGFRVGSNGVGNLLVREVEVEGDE